MPSRQVAPEASLESAADHAALPEESLQKSKVAGTFDGWPRAGACKKGTSGGYEHAGMPFAYNGKYTVAQRYPLPLETLSLQSFDA